LKYTYAGLKIMSEYTGMFNLSGRTAFVAGACGNIGRAICSALAIQGANVVVADIDKDACAIIVREIEQKTSRKHYLAVGDFTKEDDVRASIEFCSESGPLHIVVHCIGIIGSVPVPGYAVPFAEQTLKAWNLAIQTNLTSAFLLAKYAYKCLEKEGRSSVIFLSSIYGSYGPNLKLYEGTSMGNPVAYGASKGGLEQLMRYLATQWAPGIRVNCVAPGGIERGQPEKFIQRYNELTPLQRMANPEDVAGPVVFLASDAARYITGQNLMVDGGWSVW
jgi:NAD(P)-dependent dehydrogenase (short-subunit alcohol dehydrogenase family)